MSQPARAASLLNRIRELEEELEHELALGQTALHERTAELEKSLRRTQRKFKKNLYRFLRDASIQTYLVAPVIYALIFPIAFLDVMVTIYQWICFPAYGMPRVRRGPYIALDRRLPFLNVIEKLNCEYCGYANGVLAYAREIASRTEQYWCPLKHQRRIAGAHRRYLGFVEPEEAEHYRARLETMRKGVRELEKDRA